MLFGTRVAGANAFKQAWHDPKLTTAERMGDLTIRSVAGYWGAKNVLKGTRYVLGGLGAAALFGTIDIDKEDFDAKLERGLSMPQEPASRVLGWCAGASVR